MSENPLLASAVVTAIGMAVVFVAMALFYLSMHVLTGLARDRVRPAPAEAPTPPVDMPRSDARRAAVIAVALARAEQAERAWQPPADSVEFESCSPWRDFYRQRQLRPEGRGRIG